MRFNEQEIKCIKLIAHWFEQNEKLVNPEKAIKEMGIDNETYDVLMKKMEHIGAIEKDLHQIGNIRCFVSLHPSARAVELSREIEAEKKSMETPVDIVEQLKARARRNPLTAWLIIIFIIIALLVPLLNSLWELLEKIRSFFSGK